MLDNLCRLQSYYLPRWVMQNNKQFGYEKWTYVNIIKKKHFPL